MARFTSLLVAALLTFGVAHGSDEVEVWVDLSVPPLSTQPEQNLEARAALRTRIEKQQDDVMSQLAALGAKETARVTEVRNSLAVRIPSAALDEARALRGVVKVRAVKHRQRMPGGNSSN